MKSKTTTLARRFGAGFATLLAVSWIALAPQAVSAAGDEGGFETLSGGDELIKVRPAKPPATGSSLKVSLVPEKTRYRVNDRIRFKVRGNKRFFLYLFNIDPRTGKGITILPNRYQGKDRIKYPSGSWQFVPNAELEFYSDRKGTERIVMVASERYLDVGKLLEGGRSKALGDFYELESVADGLDEALSALSTEYGDDERIKVRSASSPRLPNGVVVKEVSLRIH